jgi:hypothetical protein
MFGILVTQSHAALRSVSRTGLSQEARQRASFWATNRLVTRALQLLVWLSLAILSFKGPV